MVVTSASAIDASRKTEIASLLGLPVEETSLLWDFVMSKLIIDSLRLYWDWPEAAVSVLASVAPGMLALTPGIPPGASCGGPTNDSLIFCSLLGIPVLPPSAGTNDSVTVSTESQLNSVLTCTADLLGPTTVAMKLWMSDSNSFS